MPQLLLSILAFVLIFTVIILVHECGHFFSALRFGVKVEEFGIGIPPRAKILKKKKGIIYSLNWIPFGGFVRMFGEDDPTTNRKDPRSFASKSVSQRMIIVLAGVFMNFLLAFLLLTVGYIFQMKPFILPNEYDTAIAEGRLNSQVLINEVIADTPADSADFQSEDIILSINSIPIETTNQVENILSTLTSDTATYTLQRADQTIQTTVTLDDEGHAGLWLVQQTSFPETYIPWYEAPVLAATDTVRLSVATVDFAVDFFGGILFRQEIQEGVGGPVMIASITHEIVQMGALIDLIRFAALISISLGVINVLPLPALDGGRFFFLVIEAFRGKPVSPHWEAHIHQIGFLFFLALIFMITYRDILSLW